MSISLRTHRAKVFSYADVGADGSVDSVYIPVDSPDADKLWWVSIGVPSGREYTIGMTPEHSVDAVLGFAAEVPIGIDYAVLIDEATYAVRAVLPRDYGRDELQVLVERVIRFDLTTAVVTEDITPDHLGIVPSPMVIEVGESQLLTVTVYNAANDELPLAEVTFVSSDEDVATVDVDGLVTAVAEGACTITATSGAAFDTVVISVVPETTDLLFSYNAGDESIEDAVFTRASTADYIDENDDPQTAGINIPRDDHWIAGERTLLLEDADPPRAADVIAWPAIEDGIAATEYWKYVDLDTDITEEGIDDAFLTTTDPITLELNRAWQSYKIASGVKTLVEMIAL